MRAVAPHLTGVERAEWVEILGGRLSKAAITRSRRVAAFLGQCAVESAGFQILEEDLSYSAARLCEVWPGRFADAETAEACAFQPEALANDVYANRMGNGDPASGDGWYFRGRGLIQITGRTSYERFAQEMNMSLDQAVAHAATRVGAADSAVWFWSNNDLNKLADAWLLDSLTRKINGGPTGAAERNHLCRTALHALGG
nr:glycoside hydrolase family 19 protein [uncultured Rhodopila sp.]